MLYRAIRLLVACVMSVSLLLAGCGFSKEAPAAAGKELTVKVLDIGQGDAILIKIDGQNILIDAGDDKIRDGSHKGENNNALLQALKAEGVTRVNKMIMTHAHADHIGMAPKVLSTLDVDELVYNGIPSTSKYFINSLKNAKAKGTKLSPVKEGDVIELGGGAVIRVLSPSKSMIDKDTKAISSHEKVSVNNESVVGRLEYGAFSMLFTGDAEKEIEAQLVKSYGASLESKVYKVPHHGSHTSSSTAFVKAVRPEVAVISCGAGNQYGHPHRETMSTLAKQNVKVYETDKNGTITILTDGSSYTVKGEQ